jgi:hypothetical protein
LLLAEADPVSRLSKNIEPAKAINMNSVPYRYFDRIKFSFASLKAATDPASDRSQITNPDMIGAATRIQGYVALWGLGITRTRNQIVETMPVKTNVSLRKVLFFIRLICSKMKFRMLFIPVAFLLIEW